MALNAEDDVAWFQLWQAHRALGHREEQEKAQAEFQRLRSRKREQERLDLLRKNMVTLAARRWNQGGGTTGRFGCGTEAASPRLGARPLVGDGASLAVGLEGELDRAGLPEDVTKSGPVPMLRREFKLGGAVERARAYVTSHGLYEMYLNGHRVGDRSSRPGGRATTSACSTRRTTSRPS